MTNEKEKNPSALEELRQLKRTDRIKSLDIHEPELKGFDEVSESVDITPNTSIEEVEAPIEKHTVEPVMGERAEKVEVEEAKKVVVETIDADENFTTESIENELKTFNVNPVEEEKTSELVEEEKMSELVEEESTPVLSEEDIYDDEYDEEAEAENLYEERKSFLYAEYPKIEEYLQRKSNEGYHFVRHEGKKYYFRKGQPKTYYYSMNYFVDEPDADQWREWEADGWKLVSKSDGKKKSDAGWFTFRNEEEDGEYRKEIDNDSEKFRFFKKYSSSCRSTMFLVFICMACCVVTGLLQVYFQGYLAGIALCAGLFLISFIVFCMYGRMLRKSKKRARELKSKLRVREIRANERSKDFYDTSESEEELDTDWNTLEQHTAKQKKKIFKRVDDDEE